MSRLTKEDILNIARSKDLLLVNPDDYVNLEESNLIFECNNKHRFIGNLKAVRDISTFACPVCERQEVTYVSAPPKKNGYRIIGFDQATQNFGVSVFDDGKLVYFDVMHFTGETEIRLLNIFKFIEAVCKEWEPDYVMFEDIQMQQGAYTTFKVLGELLGVVKIALMKNGIKHDCVLNKIWQAQFAIGGKDRISQKLNVINKVKLMFNVDVTDDAADAILIGKYAVNTKLKTTTKLF